MNASELREHADLLHAYGRFMRDPTEDEAASVFISRASLADEFVLELDRTPLTPEAMDAEPGWTRSDAYPDVWRRGVRYPYVWRLSGISEWWRLVTGEEDEQLLIATLGELRTLVRLHEQREAK